MPQLPRRFSTLLAPLALAFGLVGGSVLAARPATALTIDCSSAGCLGGVYTLDVAETASNQYIATYTIDTTGAFSVGATSLVDINIRVANDFSHVTLLSGPGASVSTGPLAGNGCNSRGTSAGFFCGDLSSDLAVGGVYTWRIQFRADRLLDEWHVGARYASPTHRRGWVISESGRSNPIPEPSAALVFGMGLLVAGSTVKRTRD